MNKKGGNTNPQGHPPGNGVSQCPPSPGVKRKQQQRRPSSPNAGGPLPEKAIKKPQGVQPPGKNGIPKPPSVSPVRQMHPKRSPATANGKGNNNNNNNNNNGIPTRRLDMTGYPNTHPAATSVAQTRRNSGKHGPKATAPPTSSTPRNSGNHVANPAQTRHDSVPPRHPQPRRTSMGTGGPAVPRPPMKAPPRPASLVYQTTKPAATNVNPKKHPPRNINNKGGANNLASGGGTRKNSLPAYPSQHNQQPKPVRNRTLSMPAVPASPTSTHHNILSNLLARTKSILLVPPLEQEGDEYEYDDLKPPDSTRAVVALNGVARRNSIAPPPRQASFIPGAAVFGLRSESNHTTTEDFALDDMDGLYSKAGSNMDSVTTPFPNDTPWQGCLRYMRILPPIPNELPVNRRIRIYLWSSLILDFLCAVVALATFGEVTTCCGKPIWGVGGNFDFSKAMKVIAYLYLLGIFFEAVPVVRGGIPWNMINPLFGFLISFAVFFDDSRAEAISMWILEALAVFFEFLVYRLKRRLHQQTKDELLEIDQQLEPYIMAGRVKKAAAAGGSSPPANNGTSSNATVPSLFSVNSTHEDHREIKLLRQRKALREQRAVERKYLQYHLFGVIFNCVLICITIVVIGVVARSGGMCVVGDQGPNPFATNQLETCSACQGISGTCEICTGSSTQCYYPYG